MTHPESGPAVPSITQPIPRPHRRLGPMLTAGLAAAVGLWSAWFITHLPWLGIAEQISLPILLAVWLAMAILGPRIAGVDPRRTSPLFGAGAGVVAAVLGLLILGSKLDEHAPGFEALRPSAALMALGFIGLGAVIGAVGSGLASFLPRPLTAPRDEGHWLSRLAIVAVVAVAPLLFVGGLVTSTDSGMAVPDWPNTFGSNMFLYPLGPRAQPNVYLEHSHRLFGTLVGLATLALMVGVYRNDDRRWVRRWAIVVFALVCVQGFLGGIRVTENSRLLAMFHGVLAQILFAGLVALAVFLAPAYRALIARLAASDTPEIAPDLQPSLRRLRFLATGAAHVTMMQLVFGAMYRHFRSDHALWTHAVFSVFVVILAVAAGFATMNIPQAMGRVGRIIRAAGFGVLLAVGVQFVLGWIAFGAGGREHEAATIPQALIRTVHQANGALLLALATMLYMWARPLAPRTLVAPDHPAAAAPAQT